MRKNRKAAGFVSEGETKARQGGRDSKGSRPKPGAPVSETVREGEGGDGLAELLMRWEKLGRTLVSVEFDGDLATVSGRKGPDEG